MINDHTLNDASTIPCDFELQALTPGMTLCGKYRLELEAGKGGMGVVWKAWDSIGERWVALKFIPPEIRHKEAAMAQVKAVFQTVQALSHPNICPVYCLENDSTYGYFIVKKWLEGRSLSEVKLPREQVVPILEKVAAALDYAHSEGVLHRDVKPSNIFLGDDGKVTLFDFGIAVNLHPEAQATKGQFSTSGTEKYMAPEQHKGELQTAQTDEYSLALAALELLAGTLSPLAYRKISPEIQVVLDKALSDTPAERFATCREFVDALSEKERLATVNAYAQSTDDQTGEAWQWINVENVFPQYQPSEKPIKPEFITHPISQILSEPRPKRNSLSRQWAFVGIFLAVFTAVMISLVCFLVPGPFYIEKTTLVKYVGSKRKTNVVIPGYVTVIGSDAFGHCDFMESVEIPRNVKVIEGSAFKYCQSLKSLELPEGVTEIGNYAFLNCTRLKSVVIPKSVTKLGSHVFWECNLLASAEIPGGVKELGEGVFGQCGSLTHVKISEGVTGIENYAFYGCTSLRKLIIPESVTRIGDDAFQNCPELVIYAPKGSYAEKYAQEHKIDFSVL